MDSKGLVVVFKSSESFSHPTRKRYDSRKCEKFILIRLTVLLIDSNREKLNWHPVMIFEMSSQSCYLCVISPTIERRTIRTFMIYAFRSASSKITPSTKSMEKIRSRSTFLAELLPLPQHMHILKVDRPRCSSLFTLRLPHA